MMAHLVTSSGKTFQSGKHGGLENALSTIFFTDLVQSTLGNVDIQEYPKSVALF